MMAEFKKAMVERKPTKAKDEDRYTAVSDNEDWIDPDYDSGHDENFDAMIQAEINKRKGAKKDAKVPQKTSSN